VPEYLRPMDVIRPYDVYDIVKEGPRDLKLRPFDYRNPFPLKKSEDLPLEDTPELFDYYVNGNAAIGLPGGPECAIIDIHGTLRSFTGGWAFAIGSEETAPKLRCRHLLDGCIPVVSAEMEMDGCEYSFEYFAGEIANAPPCNYPVIGNGSYHWVGSIQPKGRNIFLYAACSVRAPSDQKKDIIISTGFAQAACICAGAYYADPACYAPPWEGAKLVGTADGRYRLIASNDGIEYTLALLDIRGGDIGEKKSGFGHIPPLSSQSPQRDAEYMLRSQKSLEAGETYTVSWLVPYFPLKLEQDEALLKAVPHELRQSCIDLWESRRKTGMQISIPEEKVQDSFIQALNHLDMCSVTLDHTEFPTPGPSGGHHVFYERDSVDMIYAYDLAGEKERAERMIDHYWLRNVGQESSGMVLWLLGKHFELTKDMAWASKMFPDVIRRMSWIVQTWANRQDENGGLLPATSIADNELIEGHFVSYHLYALSGVRAAVELAKAVGEEKLSEQWNEFHQLFYSSVFKRLEALLKETGGILTPAFEGYDAKPVKVHISWVKDPYTETPAGAYGETGGIDWHNLSAVFPTGILPPHHPWITSSLERWRHVYLEGIFPYPYDGDYCRLHNYNTMNLSETWLRRGDQAETLRDLYGLLLHTTATHASAECLDSSLRLDFGCTPHNWFSGKLVRFIRDLLVYEGHDRRLHLLGCISPAWMRPGMKMGIADAPTELGSISFKAAMLDKGVEIDIEYKALTGIEEIVVHMPPFLDIYKATADGTAIEYSKDGCIIPAATKKAAFFWTNEKLPDISYTEVVKAYIGDYKKRTKL